MPATVEERAGAFMEREDITNRDWCTAMRICMRAQAYAAAAEAKHPCDFSPSFDPLDTGHWTRIEREPLPARLASP